MCCFLVHLVYMFFSANAELLWQAAPKVCPVIDIKFESPLLSCSSHILETLMMGASDVIHVTFHSNSDGRVVHSTASAIEAHSLGSSTCLWWWWLGR